MKKILKYITLSLLFAILFFTFIEIKYPILNKYMVGTARIIEEEIKCEISINGRIQNNCKFFKVNSNFYENKKMNYYVLYCRNENIELPIIIID